MGAGGGRGQPTRLCPGERTNGLVSPPPGNSAGPSATVGDLHLWPRWLIGPLWPQNPETITQRNGPQLQTPRHYLWAQQPRRWHSIWYRVILFYFQGKSSLAVKHSSDVSVNNANGSAGRWSAPTACAWLPFFSYSQSEVISKPILNEKGHFCSVLTYFTSSGGRGRASCLKSTFNNSVHSGL